MNLDDIKAAADKKYAKVPVVLSKTKTVYLLSPVQMDEARLDEALDLLETDSNKGVKTRLEKVIMLVAENEAAGKAIVDACGGNLGYLSELTSEWASELKVGEASPSDG